MGDLIPFRKRRKKWTSPEDYGGDDYGKVLPTRRWRGSGRPTRRSRWAAWKPWFWLTVLLAAWWALDHYWLKEPPLKGTPQLVSAPFYRCGKGRGPNCVVDGDTFIMSNRHIRITGIDAPEIGTKARCPAEAAQAERAATELLRLLNQGPFTMQSAEDGLRDEYGRELMSVTRARTGGPVQNVAAELIAGGSVRKYEFGARQPWC
jgi:hypothetical protein